MQPVRQLENSATLSVALEAVWACIVRFQIVHKNELPAVRTSKDDELTDGEYRKPSEKCEAREPGLDNGEEATKNVKQNEECESILHSHSNASRFW
jgi:hypothetical protein